TRGTVGSLLEKEIQYFTKFELEGRGNFAFWTSHGQIVERDCRSGHSRPSFRLEMEEVAADSDQRPSLYNAITAPIGLLLFVTFTASQYRLLQLQELDH
ncbi:hypothetical protein Gogos_008217, partial [Gossypium gossypioides]|nr:hypothetical protein [Gossypium gossypioides]